MPETMPRNSEDAAYAAYAIVDELIGLLVTRGCLSAGDVKEMLELVAKRLFSENNFASNRAAPFVADRVTGEK